MTARVVPIVEGSRMLLEPSEQAHVDRGSLPKIDTRRGASYEDVELLRSRFLTQFGLLIDALDGRLSDLNCNLPGDYQLDYADTLTDLEKIRNDLDGRLMARADWLARR